MDYSRVMGGRKGRVTDRVARRNLQLVTVPYKLLWSNAGQGPRPYQVYRDGAGQEWVQVEPGLYQKREEFDRAQRDALLASRSRG